MNYNPKAQKNIEELLVNYKSIFSDTDPEFDELFHNFTFDECIENSTLTEDRIFLVILSSLISNQSLNLFKVYLECAISYGISPVKLKELIYQCVPYIGMAKAYDFIEQSNYIFDEKGISLPLAGQSTTTSKNRYSEGLNKQIEYFGDDMISQMHESTPSNQKHFNDFLAGYCFGDFYTRGGLDDQDRELVTFSIIASLRGCENQLRGHIIANLNVDNSIDDLISVLTILVPFNGFPRTLNALNIINEICE
ncbi:MAG: carboxymuconolactone decarboxylase family protein [Methanosphaera sp.]|nr:carboxymuconolactone decarboxylase family protein [Methanosphaera sp.]